MASTQRKNPMSRQGHGVYLQGCLLKPLDRLVRTDKSASFLSHQTVGFRGGGTQCRHGRLLTIQRTFQALIEHGTDLTVVTEVALGCARCTAAVSSHQVHPVTLVLVVVATCRVKGFTAYRQKACFLIPASGVLWLGQPADEAGRGLVLFSVMAFHRPQSRPRDKRLAGGLGDFRVVRQTGHSVFQAARVAVFTN